MTFALPSSSTPSSNHNNHMMMSSSSFIDWHHDHDQHPSSSGVYSSSLCWSKGLEFVLSDRPALDAFREWIAANSNSEPLELYFALRAYERMAQQEHPQTVELALSIHMKYTSLRAGCCHFIPKKLRQDVGLRVKKLSCTGSIPDPALFSSIEPSVKNYLSRQHAQFVSSDEFLDVFNKLSMGVDTPPSARRIKRNCAPTPSTGFSNTRSNPQLTAEMLLRSRYDRQTRLGESVVERMYSMASTATNGCILQPYVCRATTSQNDSAVSSSFSSEAHPSSRLRSIREEHRRGNPTTFALPRIEHFSRSDGLQFDHSSEEGRKEFYTILSKKLLREQQRRKQNEETERQLKDIEDRRCTAREVISTAEPVDADDDDDLDRYVERMREDSQKASAQRSPRCQLLSPCPYSPDRDRSRSGPSHTVSNQSNSTVTTMFIPKQSLSAIHDCSSSTNGISKTVNNGTVNGFMPPLMTSSSLTPSPAPQPALTHHSILSHQYASPSSISPYGCYKSQGYGVRSLVYDSSGIESMAPSDHSKHSNRRVSSSSGTSYNPNQQQQQQQHHHHQQQPNRKSRTRNIAQSSTVYPLITISYKGSDGVPVVAHVPFVNGMMTLREFRKHLSISSQSNVHFFFKSPMDRDDQEEIVAPYQLLLINDDSATLPIFRGRITAELKSSSPQ